MRRRSTETVEAVASIDDSALNQYADLDGGSPMKRCQRVDYAWSAMDCSVPVSQPRELIQAVADCIKVRVTVAR